MSLRDIYIRVVTLRSKFDCIFGATRDSTYWPKNVSFAHPQFKRYIEPPDSCNRGTREQLSYCVFGLCLDKQQRGGTPCDAQSLSLAHPAPSSTFVEHLVCVMLFTTLQFGTMNLNPLHKIRCNLTTALIHIIHQTYYTLYTPCMCRSYTCAHTS